MIEEAPLGKAVVVIPTYNERENLPAIIERVRVAVPDADVLVVDDNSPDGTGEIADAVAESDSSVQVLHRAGKSGLGAAYLAGFDEALRRGYGVIVEMDADGSHQPEQLPALLDALRDADLVLGARWIPGGGAVNWPWHREMLSRGGNLYTRVMLRMPLHDATGGFRAFRASTLQGIGLADVMSQGYCFQVDLAWRAVQRGYRVVEVPITFVERTAGQSKMSQRIVVEALWRVTVWGANARLGRASRMAQPALDAEST